MTEDRWGKRYATELAGLFGRQQAQRYGVIRNVSLFGLQISSAVCFPEHTLLAVTFHDFLNKNISLEAKVRWQGRQTHRALQSKRLGHCDMGLQITRFIEGENHYRELCFNLCWAQAQQIKKTCSSNLTPGMQGFRP